MNIAMAAELNNDSDDGSSTAAKNDAKNDSKKLVGALHCPPLPTHLFNPALVFL
jgi:hypothetical protein